MRTYCHIVPGRLRLKLPGLKNSPARAERLAALALQVPGVTDAAANPTTGSLLVLFDPTQTGHESIIDFLRERGDTEIDLSVVPIRSPDPSRDTHRLAQVAGWACGAFGKEFLKLLLGLVLEDTPWSMVLALV